MKLDLGYREAATAAERQAIRNLAWEPPMLPTLRRGTVPRWTGRATWTPPDTQILVRHRSTDGSRCIVTNDRVPPRGFSIEFDLGVVHVHGMPGTERLLSTPDGFLSTPIEGETSRSYRALGHVEKVPLPMLEALEVRRDPHSGRPTLVAGPADPLFPTATPISTIGFIESYPVQPRHVHDLRHHRMLQPLLRRSDPQRWRHEYTAGEAGPDYVSLGGLWTKSQPGFVALLVGPDGRIFSDLLEPAPIPVPRVAQAKWVAAPLRWSDRLVPRAWSIRASASRIRAALRRPPAPPSQERTLGYLRSDTAPGWSPLLSATHPILGDQYLTRSALEAQDMGFIIDGVLGHIADRYADPPAELVQEVRWASRFGHRRRYSEERIVSDR